MIDVLDPSLKLLFSTGLCLVERDPVTLQIGTDPPYCTVVHNAPPGAAALLTSLDGNRPTHQILLALSEQHRIDPRAWTDLLDQLIDAGFVSAISGDGAERSRSEEACVRPDRMALTMRYGPETAGQAMRNRREAVVQIVGAGRSASSIAGILAGAGVGHIHVEPHRALRPVDVCAAGLSQDSMAPAQSIPETAGPGASLQRPKNRIPPAAKIAAGGIPRRAGRPKSSGGASAAGRAPKRSTPAPDDGRSSDDRSALAAVVHRISPLISVHPPAGYVPPTAVILAGDGGPDPLQAAHLQRRGIPHLVVRATELAGVVGPFVLPGRSSCLNCADLHRTDADPGWPMIALALSRQVAIPESAFGAALAATASAQLLQFLDGIQVPDTVNGTLEWAGDSWAVNRRTWSRHPRCPCGR